MRVGVGQYLGTVDQHSCVNLAVSNYGFLLKSVAPMIYSLFEFVEKISEVYDQNHPRTWAMLSSLNEVHEANRIAITVKSAICKLDSVQIANAIKEEMCLPGGFQELELHNQQRFAFSLFADRRVSAHAFI